MQSWVGGFVVLWRIPVLALCACAPKVPPGAAVDVVGAQQAVLAAEREWAEAVEKHDVERVLAFFAPDGASLPPDAPAVVGDGPRRAYLTRLFDEPAFESGWETSRVVIAKAGDMALSEGTTWHRGLADDGSSIVGSGKYVTVWVKIAEQWKVASDIWNETATETVPPP